MARYMIVYNAWYTSVFFHQYLFPLHFIYFADKMPNKGNNGNQTCSRDNNNDIHGFSVLTHFPFCNFFIYYADDYAYSKYCISNDQVK